MAWIDKETVKKAKEIDLLTYMQNYMPWELVKRTGREYSTKSHGSLKISNGKWIWYAGGAGGRSAVDYFVKVCGMEFTAAVNEVINATGIKPPVYIPEEELTKKAFMLPDEKEGIAGINIMMRYLKDKRGLDIEILEAEYNKGNIYVTAEHDNVAFVGRDKDGTPRLCTLRGTYGNFKNTVFGSDRRYPYMLNAEKCTNTAVHLFEAPIDALSYATLMKGRGIDYTRHNLLALCGVSPVKENGEEIKLPVALDRYLNDFPYTDTVCLHLDNDDAGKNNAGALKKALEKRGIRVLDQPPPEGFKDCNEYLLYGEPQVKAIMEKQAVRHNGMERQAVRQ